jgi:hypothetical protein
MTFMVRILRWMEGCRFLVFVTVSIINDTAARSGGDVVTGSLACKKGAADGHAGLEG